MKKIKYQPSRLELLELNNIMDSLRHVEE